MVQLPSLPLRTTPPDREGCLYSPHPSPRSPPFRLAPQTLNLSPTSGPLLIMTFRMIHDLVEFLKLALLVVFAFAGAFYVLVHAAAIERRVGLGSEVDDQVSSGMLSLSGVCVVGVCTWQGYIHLTSTAIVKRHGHRRVLLCMDP